MNFPYMRLIVFVVLMSGMFSMSQTTVSEIAGDYYISTGNPEGGMHLVIMPNEKFVLSYFGGVRQGTWKSIDNVYYLEFYVESQFVLYGRKNTSIQDSVSIRVGLGGNRGSAIRIDPLKNEGFTPMFNEDSNCYSYPYIYKQSANIQRIEVYAPDLEDYHKNETYESSRIYRFDIDQNYNEFFLAGLPFDYSKPQSFKATFEKEGIVINGEEAIRKSRDYDQIGEEDRLFFELHANNEMLPVSLEHSNEFFPYYENPTEADLKPYTRIEPELHTAEGIEILKSSLFTARCSDDE